MNCRNVSQVVIGLTIVIFLLAGCGPQETVPADTSGAEVLAPTPTSVAETRAAAPTSATAADVPTITPTPVPPTAMPTSGFKVSSQCPDSDVGVPVPERLPNAQWSTMNSPSDARIWAIEVLSPSDAWAVDLQGNILHYDGNEWMLVDSPTSAGIRGLSMLSANEGWAVGYEAQLPHSSFILHYADQNWSSVSIPETTDLSDVDFAAPNSGWAVGSEILHYDGDGWTIFSSEEELGIPPAQGVSEKYGSLRGVDMVSADEGWAVGDGGTILHYQDNTWQQVDSPAKADLKDVLLRSSEDGWIIGAHSTLLHFDGSSWSIVTPPTEAYFSAIDVDAEGRVWVAGSAGLPHGCVLLRFDGQTWTQEELPGLSVSQQLDDIDAGPNGTVWLVGENGLILRRELLDTQVPLPSPPLLETIDNSDGDGNFSVSWESVPGNIKYVLQEADDSMCPVTIYLGAETSKDVSRKDIGTYYYRVSALGISGQGEWSEIESVEVTIPLPPCSLECTGSWAGTGPSLDIRITCEAGELTQSISSWQAFEEDRGLVTNFEGTRTYKDTGNEYKIVADASPYIEGEGKPIEVDYHVEVTGGAFGDTPQVCED